MIKFYSWYIKELEAQKMRKQADKKAEEKGIERYVDNRNER